MGSLSKTVRALIVAGALMIAVVDVWIAGQRLPQDLELEINRSSADAMVQARFDTGEGYHESGRLEQTIPAGTGLQRLVFPLPKRSAQAVRLDFPATGGPAVVIIDSARITAKSFRRRREDTRVLDLRRVTPWRDVARTIFHADTGALEIVPVPGATRPQCVLTLEQPAANHWRAAWEFLWKIAPLNGLLVVLGALATRHLWAANWRAWIADNLARRRWSRLAAGAALAATLAYVWLLLLNLRRIPLEATQEPSWVAVLTHAVAHGWQYGRDVIMTYGPAMPLTICCYIDRMDPAVFVARLLFKACAVALFIWLGGRLRPGRRSVFWLVSVALAGAFSEQALCGLSIAAAGLLFAKGGRADRWLLAPALVYVAALALVKETFLMSAAMMLVAVAADRAWQRKWVTAVAPAVAFVTCFLAGWCLLGQRLSILPLYLRGAFEIVDGYSQAMSLPPEPGTLRLGIIVALLAAAQLIWLALAKNGRRVEAMPMIGLVGVGGLLAWKQGFVRADNHVVDWFVFTAISAAAAPAFFTTGRHVARRWVDAMFLILILTLSVTGLGRADASAGAEIAALFRDRWPPALQTVLHPGETARAEQAAVAANRRRYALPLIRARVGQSPVDVFCDEQAVAILNDLNYRPRPSFLSYSTYTPWLVELDEAFYTSAQAPDYVLFKLETIDRRLPTLQNAPLLLLLAQRYEPVLVEQDFALLHRRAGLPPVPTPFEGKNAAGVPLTLAREGDIALDENLPLPTDGSCAWWCELELRETPWGKALGTFYQQPPVWLAVTCRAGAKTTEYRLVPRLAGVGFLINPLPTNTEEFLRWLAGKPLDEVQSIRVANAPALAGVFQPRVHYKFCRVPTPPPAVE